jgi:outer membrane immunogenic protein
MKINGLKGIALAALAGFVAVSAVGMAAIAPASAADMAVKAPVYKAPPLAYRWSGCYVGATLGWGMGNDWKSADLNGFNPGGISPWDLSVNTSVEGGGTLGCNWQPTSLLVLGIEGEGGYLNLSGPLQQQGAGNVTVGAKLGSGYGLIAGRVGLAFDRALLYGKVGVGFYDTSATVTGQSSTGATISGAGSKSEDPFAFGGGFEYAIADHWSGKAEYMMFEKGSSYNACGGAFCWKETPSAVQMFKLGLNYKFF